MLISRRARRPGDDWDKARSWFGGLPKLGAQPWPRGAKSGRPLPFAAQLDLAELAAAQPGAPLPKTGSLAVFLDEGAVVYVPATSGERPTAPPPDAIPAFDPHGDLFPAKPSPQARPTFPRWPVEIVVFDIPPPPPSSDMDGLERLREEMTRVVDRSYRRREYFLSARIVAEATGERQPLFWWHGAQAYADQLKTSLFDADDYARADRPYLIKAREEVARLTPPPPRFPIFGRRGTEPDPALQAAQRTLAREEARAAEHQRQRDAMPEYVAEVEAFARGRDPWARLTPDQFAAFAALYERRRTQFDTVARYRTATNLDELATESLRAMMTGDARAFAALPESVRDYVNEHCRLPTGAWHQTFGLGVDIQGSAVWEHEEDHLLLQLVYDDMIDWRFGDMGAYQFWISPAELAAGNWSAVQITFECS